MSRVKENIVERYAHFAILGVSALISLALVAMLVIKSPNSKKIDGSSFGPGQIDQKILSKAKMLDTKLRQDPEPKERYISRYSQFEKIFAMSLEGYEGLNFPIPSSYNSTVLAQRYYDVPSIPELSDVEVRYVREVAFVPQVKVDTNRPYGQVDTAAEDIDLVTVEAKLNFAQLAENFRKSFNSAEIKREWRDPELAKVIFAKAELQRQYLIDDSKWSEWEDVGRSRIDQYAGYMDFSDDVNKLKKGVDVLRIQFQSNDLWQDLLQPQAYDIAQADLKWYPPSLYSKYLQQKKEADRNRLKPDKGRRGATRAVRGSRTTRATRRPPASNGPDTTNVGGLRNGRDTHDRRPRNSKTRTPKVKKNVGLDQQYESMLIAKNVNVEDLPDSISIWAHDDSPKANTTYRYRLRIGVFNPIVGRNWCNKEYDAYNDKVVLWSEYTQPTSEVTIEGREYILPISQTAKGVKVTVAKYNLGLWQGHEFIVSPGDKIGDIVEIAKTAKKQDRNGRGNNVRQEPSKKVIEEVDFTTGATFVKVQDATVTLSKGGVDKEVKVKEFVYTYDGENNLSAYIGKRYWTPVMLDVSKKIKADKSREIEIIPHQGASSTRGSRGGKNMGGGINQGLPPRI